MANPVNIEFNSASPGFTLGPQEPIAVDFYQGAFSARVGIWIPVGSTASYSVEYCMDDINNASLTPRWFTDSTLNQWQTASATTTYTAPIQCARVNINALSGTLEQKLLQGSTPGECDKYATFFRQT